MTVLLKNNQNKKIGGFFRPYLRHFLHCEGDRICNPKPTEKGGNFIIGEGMIQGNRVFQKARLRSQNGITRTATRGTGID